MDLKNTGKFIAKCRYEQNLTQEELAEKLFITNRAVSKWERGLSLPDAGIMLDLCNILKINVNELLCGERINMENYQEKNEKLLLELSKSEENKNKKLIFAMRTILIISTIFYTEIILLAVFLLKEGLNLDIIITVSTLIYFIPIFIGLKFEVDAGYYECKNCHHKFVPTYKEALFSSHIFTTRYLKCPNCKKKSWSKKIVS